MCIFELMKIFLSPQVLKHNQDFIKDYYYYYYYYYYIALGHAVAYWSRHYGTNRKVACSVLDEVNF
jgi:hypothetical protein